MENMVSMEPPVTVEIPNFRFETACVLAVWSHPVLQQRLWIDGESKGFESLYFQLGDVMDTHDLLPTVESPMGTILANDTEVSAFNDLGAVLDEVLLLKGIRVGERRSVHGPPALERLHATVQEEPPADHP